VLRTTTVIAAFAFALAASIPARAELPAPRLVPELSLSKDKGVESAPRPDPWTTRKRTISLQGGAPGGPTGLVGLSFEYAPISGSSSAGAADGRPRAERAARSCHACGCR
jgi:hypothetical protein